ncbi:heat shock protein 22 [Musca vetustissima]|uniref:heat shock protein 22 n=1 Tax=Musca vetustissima TaxID=27455 RepID=UPI002AB5F553|nr:heat shock protein 22 [Musca vetustissima]
MRTLPILWRMAEDLRRLAMPSSPFFEYPWTTSYRWAPFAHMNRMLEEDMTKFSKDGGYQVSMNVSEFKPEELSVKVVDNNVIVEGKSEQHHDNDGGYISRHFVRRFTLPKGYESDNAISTLTSDGILTVSVPKPQIEEKAREIPIQRAETESIKSGQDAKSSENKK